MNSIFSNRKTGLTLETGMNILFFLCGLIVVLSVVFISIYLVISGWPIISELGLYYFLMGEIWYPDNNQFGILPMILASLYATLGAIIMAMPIGVLVAVFLAHIAPRGIADLLRSLINLLAAIPSVVYGLLGAILIVPLIFKLQKLFNLPTGGSLLAAILVFIIMILPTIISVSTASIMAVPSQYYEASLALGASKMQSYFRVIIPAAKSGIVAGMVLGTGRAIGEAMAVMMVAGNAPIMPELLKPVRLLTASIPIEWAYSSGLHREALYGIGLVLFVFIMIINLILYIVLKRGGVIIER